MPGLSGESRATADQASAMPVRVLLACPRIASLSSMALGAAVLAGWAFDISFLKSVIPDQVTMKVNTAVGFVLAGAGLGFFLRKQSKQYVLSRHASALCAAALAALGILTLAQYILGVDLRVDELLFRDEPSSPGTLSAGRMAPLTALNFLLIGVAIWLRGREDRRAPGLAVGLAYVAFLNSALTLLRYALTDEPFVGLAAYAQMAVHTSLGFMVVGLGVLLARIEQGPMAVLSSNGVGGSVARRLLPVALAIPPVLGWLRWRGEQAGLYGGAFGVALFATVLAGALSLFIWWMARGLEASDATRRNVEAERDRFFTLSLDLLCVTGFDGYFKRLNPAWENVLGFTTQELLERPYLDLVHPQDRKPTVVEAQRLSGGGVTLSFENRYLTRSGASRWFLWSAVAVPSEERIYAVARDITERKQAEEQIRSLNRELEQRVADLAASNRELEAFSYSVSHDLRAPLRQVHGFSRVVAEQYAPQLDAQCRHYLGRIEQGAAQMGRLIDDLLNLSRLGRQPLRREATQIATLVEEVRAQLETESHGRKVEWRIQPLPPVDCDPGLMKQVFANLLANSLKYTRPREQALIEIGMSGCNGDQAIFVRDNGVGFSMKYAGKLFGVFQRLHRSDEFEGTGVGLATVQRIIHKHGGRIWADGEEGKGATFSFTLGGQDGSESQPSPEEAAP